MVETTRKLVVLYNLLKLEIMKITIDSHVLRDGMNKILTVIDKKNSRPILTNCLFHAEDGKIELIATDLEVTAKVILIPVWLFSTE